MVEGGFLGSAASWSCEREAWGFGIGCCSFYPIHLHTVQLGKLRPKELRTKRIYMKGLNIRIWFRQGRLECLTPNPKYRCRGERLGGQAWQDN